jgi:hypothetical protein
MEFRMRSLARLVVCLLVACAAAATEARAGVLVEALFNGQKLRAEIGRDRNLVLVSVDGERLLVDVERQQIYRLGDGVAAPIRAAGVDDGGSRLPYTLRQWSAGPQVAGHASTYHVLQVDEQICGEVLASAWMAPFIAPITRSLELLQRVEPELRPVDRDACGAIPFGVYARNGWPLMAGWVDEAAFVTETVRFDHQPDESLFRRPG